MAGFDAAHSTLWGRFFALFFNCNLFFSFVFALGFISALEFVCALKNRSLPATAIILVVLVIVFIIVVVFIVCDDRLSERNSHDSQRNANGNVLNVFRYVKP